MISYHTMNDQEKEIISARQYEGDYGIYNLPPYEEQKASGVAFGNQARAKNYCAYYDGDHLIGFTNLSEGEEEVSVGIGVHPNLCGRGYGRLILMQAAAISQALYPGKRLVLEVRTWNQRAIRCYEAAGFQMDGMPFERLTAVGKGMFYRMIKV